MPRASLELTRVQINSPRERWRTYFVMSVSPSFCPEQTALVVLPDFPMLFTRRSDNRWSFVPEGEGADGLLAFSDDVEIGSYRRIGMWVYHSRDLTRSTGEVLSSVADTLGSVASAVPLGLSSAFSWALIAPAAAGGIGGALEALEDRDLGFINMDERFGEEFSRPGVLERSQTCSSGLVTLGWKWVISKETR